jgi:hypothetical protein
MKAGTPCASRAACAACACSVCIVCVRCKSTYHPGSPRPEHARAHVTKSPRCVRRPQRVRVFVRPGVGDSHVPFKPTPHAEPRKVESRVCHSSELPINHTDYVLMLR